jgi:hypothetical protein
VGSAHEREADVRVRLEQCAAACERALARYKSGIGLTRDHHVVQSVVSAMAAVATAADYLEAEPEQKKVALSLAVHVCTGAASECRRYGLDQDLLLCAAACDRAAAEADRVLGSLAA